MFDVENASFILRRMEKDAFQAVLSAFRAQGPLSPYKEALLDHLRTALFIRENDFIEMIRATVDNVFTKRICKTLNASYSCSAQWRAYGMTAFAPRNPEIRLAGQAGPSGADRAKLITNIGCHNVSVRDLDIATAKLCNLKKEPYVPQQLRRALYDTELAYGRVDIDTPDVTEEELRKDLMDYEKEVERVTNEITAEEARMRDRGRRGGKRKQQLPLFYDQTIRTQARVAEENAEQPSDHMKKVEERILEEEELERAEFDMMKMIDNQEKMAQNSNMPIASPLSRPKPRREPRPKKAKMKESVANSVLPSTVHGAAASVSAPNLTSKSSSVHLSEPTETPSFLSNNSTNSMPVVTQVMPLSTISPVKRMSDEQRAIDEQLVLVKTAQAMIEGFENRQDIENGYSPRKKAKQVCEPKKRGRKPLEPNEGCARCRPFSFDGPRGDVPNKMPRGNPDKRSSKRNSEQKNKSVTNASSSAFNAVNMPITHLANSQNAVVNGSLTSSEKLSSTSPVTSPRANSTGLPPSKAIVPVSPATIVIRPRTNSTSTTSPSTSSTNVAVDGSPAKRMRYTIEASNANATGSTIPVSENRIFPVMVRPGGRPTMFRPPNVVFPRSANALSNGNVRFTGPFTSQSTGTPARPPFYGNPLYAARVAGVRERPQLHTFARPPAGSVIRLVTSTSEPKVSEKSPSPKVKVAEEKMEVQPGSLSESNVSNSPEPSDSEHEEAEPSKEATPEAAMPPAHSINFRSVSPDAPRKPQSDRALSLPL